MQVVETKVSHRKTPPSACVEFLGAQGESIEVELRGDEYADMGDEDVVRRARAAMSGAGALAGDTAKNEAGIDQTFNTP